MIKKSLRIQLNFKREREHEVNFKFRGRNSETITPFPWQLYMYLFQLEVGRLAKFAANNSTQIELKILELLFFFNKGILANDINNRHLFLPRWYFLS